MIEMERCLAVIYSDATLMQLTRRETQFL